MRMTYETRQAYTQYFASLTWDKFCTYTFRKNYTPNGARRAAQRFHAEWPTLELGVLFIESGSLYGKVHLHGLLRFDRTYTPPNADVWSAWWERYGYAEVEDPRSVGDIANYCTKYCTKHLAHETYLFL